MTVYVDEPVHRFGRMIMCHMVSPDLGELHAMADRIGVPRKWFQDPRSPKVSRPHYDIAKSKRTLAIRFGAVPIDKYQMVAISNVALNRFFDALGVGDPIDPLAIFRGRVSGKPHAELPRLEAWLARELGE